MKRSIPAKTPEDEAAALAARFVSEDWILRNRLRSALAASDEPGGVGLLDRVVLAATAVLGAATAAEDIADLTGLDVDLIVTVLDPLRTSGAVQRVAAAGEPDSEMVERWSEYAAVIDAARCNYCKQQRGKACITGRGERRVRPHDQRYRLAADRDVA